MTCASKLSWHIQQLVDSDPQGQWIFIADQLNTHKSASLVKWIAEQCGIEDDLGEKSKEGILQNMASRTEFLQDEKHRISFIYTPKHCSWLNQVEIWFGLEFCHGVCSSVGNLSQRMNSKSEF